ncbi:Ankyrin repeat-containing domain [Phytophthora cactorum]|nr:Ankyrin repeat-containing domain [Phytophthora cactorum]
MVVEVASTHGNYYSLQRGWSDNRTCRQGNPAVASLEENTQVVSRFIGPPSCMSFSEACSFESIALLEWIWSVSPTSAASRTNNWSPTNYLHCTVPKRVVEQVKSRGHLSVLQYLWEHRDSSPVEWHLTHCTVVGYEVMQKAVENGQIRQCLTRLVDADKISALRYALEIGDVELAQLLVPINQCMLDYASGSSHIKVLELLLDGEYLTRDSELAASALPTLVAQGTLELIQHIFQLHSPLPEHHDIWKTYRCVALNSACARGDLPILQTSVWNEAYEMIKQEDLCLRIAVKHDHVPEQVLAATEEACRVHVGNLLPKAKEIHLTSKFARFGTIHSVWIARRPPVFAFVQFANPDAAQRAVDTCREGGAMEILGKAARVQWQETRTGSRQSSSRRSTVKTQQRRGVWTQWRMGITTGGAEVAALDAARGRRTRVGQSRTCSTHRSSNERHRVSDNE